MLHVAVIERHSPAQESVEHHAQTPAVHFGASVPGVAVLAAGDGVGQQCVTRAGAVWGVREGGGGYTWCSSVLP